VEVIVTRTAAKVGAITTRCGPLLFRYFDNYITLIQ
jgi:hypothetical protein